MRIAGQCSTCPSAVVRDQLQSPGDNHLLQRLRHAYPKHWKTAEPTQGCERFRRARIEAPVGLRLRCLIVSVARICPNSPLSWPRFVDMYAGRTCGVCRVGAGDAKAKLADPALTHRRSATNRSDAVRSTVFSGPIWLLDMLIDETYLSRCRLAVTRIKH